MLAAPNLPQTRSYDRGSDRLLLAAAAGVGAALLAAAAHRLATSAPLWPQHVNPWLVLHLASVLPALPLGAIVLLRRKGDRFHRLLGRLWAALMMAAALSSFGLHYLNNGLSWIHLLSAVTVIALPRSIIMAARGNISAHRRGMRAVYIGLLVAGGFAFLPGRLLGQWLFG